MNLSKDTLVSEVVKFNFGTASLFREKNIDFCCGGHISIDEACKAVGADADVLLEELQGKVQVSDPDSDYINSLELDALVDYIVNRHHSYVRKAIPFLKEITEKISNRHGESHPELLKVQKLFNDSAGELIMHMQKEELVLFPYIKRLAKSKREKSPLMPAPFGSVANPIRSMEAEHAIEGERFEKIVELTNNYTVPADGCTSYRVAFQNLQDFEKDLHRHIHLENNILYPKAIELEAHLIS